MSPLKANLALPTSHPTDQSARLNDNEKQANRRKVPVRAAMKAIVRSRKVTVDIPFYNTPQIRSSAAISYRKSFKALVGWF